MTKLSTEELEAIRKRVEKATDGPWNWDGDLTYRKNGLLEPLMSGGTFGEVLIEENDANFIAHAREDIPKLLAEVERLREVIIEAIADIETISPHEAKKTLREALNNGEN